MKTTLIGFLTIVVTITSCNGTRFSEDDDNGGGSGNAPLQYTKLASYDSCSELVEDYRQTMINYMEDTLDSYNSYFDCDNDEAMTSIDSGDSGAGFTATNLQEEEVDEADIVKTDGEYLYAVSDAGVSVFQVWPFDAFQKVGEVGLDMAPSEIYLSGGKLVALGKYKNTELNSYVTQVAFINVDSPANPYVERIKEIEGYNGKSRLVNGVLHLTAVISRGWSAFDVSMEYPDRDWDLWTQACSDGEGAAEAQAALDASIEEAKAVNKETILALNLSEEDILPKHGDGSSFDHVDCSLAVKDDETVSTSLTSLVSLDVRGDGEQITVIKGRSLEIYASTESFYFAANNSSEDATILHRFSIKTSAGLHAYIGGNTVTGHINNSFSMSEYEGTFRVATTVGTVSRSGDTEVYNNVYVLDVGSAEMPVIGSVEKIAEGEKIYAARFFGDRGYLVTFKKVDPLFVVDLSDPETPVITGELEMPGYSTYLHQLDEDHIIGLGKAAEEAEEGDFAWFQGLKLALFDVSDDTQPALDNEVIIGSRGTGSTALTDHHAFTFDADTGVLALPLAYYSGGMGGSDWGDFEYYGVHLYGITADGGIQTIAEIQLLDASSIQRTVLMDDDDSEVMYVLDRDEQLFQIDLTGSYEVRDVLSL